MCFDRFKDTTDYVDLQRCSGLLLVAASVGERRDKEKPNAFTKPDSDGKEEKKRKEKKRKGKKKKRKEK